MIDEPRVIYRVSYGFAHTGGRLYQNFEVLPDEDEREARTRAFDYARKLRDHRWVRVQRVVCCGRDTTGGG